MELSTIKLHTAKLLGKAETQITLDDDYNVPDYRPDIVKIIRQQGSIKLEEVKPTTGAVWIKGKLIFKVLYRSDQESGKTSCLKGELSFGEKLNMDGIGEYDPVRVTYDIEDLSIGVIHSRKLNVRAVLVLRATSEGMTTLELVDGVDAQDDCMQLQKSVAVSQLLLAKRDICRQKNEIILPSSKPNVREILWKSIELRNVGSRLEVDGLHLNGEVLLSILYQEEEEPDRIQWYETTLPLDCKTEMEVEHLLNGQDVFYKVEVEDVSKELDIKQDYDGEERMLALDLQIPVKLRIWLEESVKILEDAYSLKKNLLVTQEEMQLEHLLMKNDAVCKMTEQLALMESQEKILQICSVEGKARIDRIQILENEALVEGTLTVMLLYITTDDHMPVDSIEQIFPFEQRIELPQSNQPLRLEQECIIEQLSASMLDQSHAEIKAAIGINMLVFAAEKFPHITGVKEEELDVEELQKLPGLIGYIAKKGDTLWSIAKEYHTTPETIMYFNQKKEEDIRPGEKLLIVKEV